MTLSFHGKLVGVVVSTADLKQAKARVLNVNRDSGTISDHLPENKFSGLGPFLYVIMINDLVVNGLLLDKFIDDSTVTETIDNPAESKMQDASDNVVKWT